MAITISGENNNDKILASDGVIDQISGINIVGLITASHINVGSNIQLGNAGIITATTFVGNLTGNVNSTSPLLLQTGGSERFRITSDNALGIAGANYGSSGQVLTSGGSGSAVTWSAIPSQVTIANNAVDRVITGGSGTNLNGEANLTFNGSTLTATGGFYVNGTQNASLTSNQLIFDRPGYSYVDQVSDSGSLVFRVTSGYINALRLDSSGQAHFISNVIIPDAIQHNGDLDTKIRFPGSNQISFETGNAERMKIDNIGHVTINSTSYQALTITTSENGVNGPEIQLMHNTASPAANDVVGQLRYSGKDSAGNTELYAKIQTKVDDATSGQETGHIDFSTRGLGAYNSIFRLKARGSASAPSYTADDMNGIILDTYNTGNPYPRYFNFIAKSAGNTDSNIGFWTEAVGGSPTEKLRITSGGQLLHTANKSSGYTARFNQAHADNPAEIEINSPADNNLRPASIQLMNAGTDKWGIGQVYNSASSAAFHICAGSTSQSNSKFTITTSGYVGINEISPQQQLHVHGDTDYQGILVNGSSAPRIAFARSTTTTGEWSVGIDGTNGNNFCINRSNDNSNRYFVISNGQTNSNQNTVVNGVFFNNDIRSTTSTNDDSTSNVKISARNAAGGHGNYCIIGVSGNTYFGAGANSYSSNPSGNNVNGGTTIRVYGGISSNAYNDAHRFGRNTDGSIVIFQSAGGTEGSIAISGTTTNYNTSSDYRLKENIVNITDGITRLKQLKPRRFNFIKHPSITKDGFIAHEVDSIIPEAVTGTKDETFSKDDEVNNIKAGDPKYQQMDASKLIPLLTAALQEAITEIETLKTKVAALEGS